MFRKKDVLKNFAKFLGKILCWYLFFNKVADLSPATLLGKRLRHRVFFCELCQIFKSIFFYRTPPVAASVINKYLGSKYIQLPKITQGNSKKSI